MADTPTAITAPAPASTTTVTDGMPNPSGYMDAASHRAAIMSAIEAEPEGPAMVSEPDTAAAATTDPALTAPAVVSTPPAAEEKPDPVAALTAQVSALTGIVEKIISAQAAPAKTPAPTEQAALVDPDMQGAKLALGGDHVPDYLAAEEQQRRQRLAQWKAYEARATDDAEKAKAAGQIAALEQQGQRLKREAEREKRLAQLEQRIQQQADEPKQAQEVAQRVERAKTVLTADKVKASYPQLGAAMAAGHVDIGAALDKLAAGGAMSGTPEEYGQTIEAVLAVLDAAFKQPAPPTTEPKTAPVALVPSDPGNMAPVTGPGTSSQTDNNEYLSHRELKKQTLRTVLGAV